MAVAVVYSSFNLHQAGKSANDAARDLAEIKRADSLGATKDFQDTNRDFAAEGVDTTYRIEVLDGSDVADYGITAVVTDTITTDHAGTFTGENNLRYRVYLPPTSSEIISDQDKRGRGIAGYQELLNALEAAVTGTFLTSVIDISYAEGNTQQMITYDDT